ncbi:hypothetical protein KEJ25_10155 [Candidatus Bathyarchaeota archaeon]|nr:hypothetical protein [Candidatus Bathyarchaeota archaeon]
MLKEANAPFDVTFSLGRYKLAVEEKEVCELSIKNNLHYDRSSHGPAVIFAMKDYKGKEHLLKLVSKEYVSKIMIGQFRPIKSVKYDEDRNKLIVEYHKGEGKITYDYEVFLENPDTVLMRRIKEVRDLLNEGTPRDDPKVTGPVGENGEDYTRFYREEDSSIEENWHTKRGA